MNSCLAPHLSEEQDEEQLLGLTIYYINLYYTTLFEVLNYFMLYIYGLILDD